MTAAEGSFASEVARRFRLKAQLEHPLAGHPYDMSIPPPGFDETSVEDAAGSERLIEVFKACVTEATGTSDLEIQRRLVWTALHLEDEYERRSRADGGLAALKAALGALSDRGHKDLVRCRLALNALRAGDVAAAESWLGECDPAPEIIDLDSAYRQARALLLSEKGDFRGVLALLGDNLEELPVAKPQRPILTALRLHALESVGRHEEARVELDKASTDMGLEVVLGALARGNWAPALRAEQDCVQEAARVFEAEERERARVHSRESELLRLLAERRDLRTGTRALSPPLAGAPVLALVLLLFPITPIRCFCSADPFMGMQGHLLCPHVCEGCTGPYRVHTVWNHHGGGESSTNGPQYFCQTPRNGVATMSDAEMSDKARMLGRYELHFAPAAATYLSLLVLLLPVALYLAGRTHVVSIAKRARLKQQALALHAELRAGGDREGSALPPFLDTDTTPPPTTRGLPFALGLFAVCGVIPFLVIVIEILAR